MESEGQARLVIDDAELLLDEPVRLRLEGVKAGRRVRIVATSTDANGARHTSWAEYRTDSSGGVEPARQAPLAGTYAGVDPWGLWWSMRARPERVFPASLEPVATNVVAEADGQSLAVADFDRLRLRPGVGVEPLHEGGLRGMLFLPARPHAGGVVVLGGSEGGSSQAAQVAALMASRGIAALALAYFGVEGLPRHLVEIPVEYVEDAIAWMCARAEVRRGRIGIVGSSRGAELALLVAAECKRVGAVAAFAGSAIAWPGIGRGASPRCAWTRGGACVPYAVPMPADISTGDGGKPRVLRDGFLQACRDAATVARCAIPVERIAGPLLMVSGGDDRLWPSDRFAAMAMQRRSNGARGFSDRHLRYAGAGHTVVRPPGLPAAPTAIVHPFDGTNCALGGTRAANARASAGAWPHVLALMRSMGNYGA